MLLTLALTSCNARLLLPFLSVQKIHYWESALMKIKLKFHVCLIGLLRKILIF